MFERQVARGQQATPAAEAVGMSGVEQDIQQRWNIGDYGAIFNQPEQVMADHQDDFARYLLHRVMHEVPALWAFHKVHHSARTLTPLTVMRTHPVEGVLFALRSALVQGITIGSFLYLFGSQVDLITVLGVNAAVFVFNVLGSNLRHSHVQLWYPKAVEHLFISPAQHQIHHSTAPRHFDKNYGAVLAIWDWLGGSLHLSEPGADIRFGVSDRIEAGEHSLKQLYLTPFRESYLVLRKAVVGICTGRKSVTTGD